MENTLFVGQAVVHSDMANYREGHIVGFEEENKPTYSSCGLQPAGRKVIIAFPKEGSVIKLIELMLGRWITDATHEPINEEEAKALHKQCLAAQEKRNEKQGQKQAQAALDRAAFVEDAQERLPEWAKAVIIAEFHQDTSDSMSDYYAHDTAKTLILAWSKHTRDLFPEMRKAANNAGETQHLAKTGKNAEHRNKYSMGDGYFLKDGGSHSNGWCIKKVRLYNHGAKGIPTGEWRLPQASTVKTKPKEITGDITVTINEEKNGIEIRFPGKPSNEVRGTLKDREFRWSRTNTCWYKRFSEIDHEWAKTLASG